MQKSNCHTHTIYCDGKNTAREMVEAAIEKGFTSLGFSGHSPMINESEWTMSPESTKLYCEEIRALKKEYADKLDILCGIELDNRYSGIDVSDFDYVIGSVHQFEKNGKIYEIDYTPELLSKAAEDLFDGSFNKMCKDYYETLADFIVNEKVDIVGHIDLVTKFNLDTVLFDEGDETYRKCAFSAVDKILKNRPGMIFEVNTGAMYRVGKKEPYPAAFLLRYICQQGGRVTLTSDSHNVESLDFAFEKAKKFIKDCGFNEILHLTSHGWKKEKVSQSI